MSTRRNRMKRKPLSPRKEAIKRRIADNLDGVGSTNEANIIRMTQGISLDAQGQVGEPPAGLSRKTVDVLCAIEARSLRHASAPGKGPNRPRGRRQV